MMGLSDGYREMRDEECNSVARQNVGLVRRYRGVDE